MIFSTTISWYGLDGNLQSLPDNLGSSGEVISCDGNGNWIWTDTIEFAESANNIRIDENNYSFIVAETPSSDPHVITFVLEQ